jgi:Ca-activated chloride channel family protein
MRFGNIHAAYLLWLVLGVIVFYLWAFKRRRRALEEFAQRELLPQLTASLDIKKQRLKISLIILAICLSLFSLLRPQWGFHWEEVKRKGLDILIAIDTSKSMLAEDVKPNRLERSKLAVKDLLRKLKGDRIGLIAFSGTAFLQCPLTVDYNGFMLSLNDLSVGTIPRGGTSISSAIREAIKSYEGGQKKYKILILITDGEDHEGDPLKAAKEAKKEGIKIFRIGIGTEEGELIPITDEAGNKVFLKDRQGNVVKTRLDEVSLQKIALSTGGSYVRASGAEFGLDLIYEKKLSKMEKREFESRMRKHYEERFQIPLAIALLLLFLEPFISERRALR